jgi:hypothetical protein
VGGGFGGGVEVGGGGGLGVDLRVGVGVSSGVGLGVGSGSAEGDGVGEGASGGRTEAMAGGLGDLSGAGELWTEATSPTGGGLIRLLKPNTASPMSAPERHRTATPVADRTSRDRGASLSNGFTCRHLVRLPGG